jgi:hypothetical protein
MGGFDLARLADIRIPSVAEQTHEWTRLALRPLIEEQSQNLTNAILQRTTDVQVSSAEIRAVCVPLRLLRPGKTEPVSVSHQEPQRRAKDAHLRATRLAIASAN